MSQLKRNIRTTGFTLVELLIVLAIVAMLASLLMPVFASVREKARQTGCLSNLQQIGTSISLYAQDYDGIYPLGVNGRSRISAHESLNSSLGVNYASIPALTTVLGSYTRNNNIWSCASDNGFERMLKINAAKEEVALPSCSSAFKIHGTSYIYRTNLGLQQIRYPANAYTFDLPTQEIGSSQVGILTDIANWHGDTELNISRGNVLFADGHVKSQNQSQFIQCWFFPLQPPKDDD